jgi:hypothetical protein
MSVMFLPGSWNVPQTVTVTGVDTNGQEDGDVGYRIITAPATTASNQDPYSGIDAPDVLVVNQVVDNAPTLDQPAALAINEDAALQTIDLTGITSGQASEVQSLVVTAVSADPTLTGPLQVSYVDRATTGSVTFTPLNDAHGSTSISIAVSDGTTTTTRTVTVAISPINDLPVVSRNKPITVTLRGTGALHGAQPLADDPNQLAATDVETASAALVFRVMLVPGGGVLKVDGATVENDGSFTQAQLEAGLVTYTHAGGGGTTDGFTFKVEDGDGGASSPNVFRINIDRRAPNVAVAPTVPGTLTYTENDAPLLLADQSTVDDTDNTSFNGAQVRLAISAGAGAGDVLQVLPRTTGVGVLTVASGSIFIDGVAVATLSGGTGGADLVVTGALVATPVHFQAIVQCLAYANASEAPTAGTRNLSLTITDPDATVAGPLALRPVTVVTVNDAPVLTALPFVTATGRAFDGIITATDPDGPAITFGLATPAVKGTVSLTPSTGAFTYTPAAGLSGIDTFVVSATDGVTPATPLTVTVRITGRGATVRPWITSDPPAEVQAGDLLRFTVAVDPRELPVGYDLSFSADGAPSGMVITKDGPASAVVTWTAVVGTANHLLFTITATDATSGSMATLPVTLFVQPAASGGG